MVKNTISKRISKKLHFSKEDISIFESLKKVVLKIDNNYWRRVSDNRQRYQTIKVVQSCFSKDLKFETPLASNILNKTLLSTSIIPDYTQTLSSALRISQFPKPLHILDLDI